MGRRGGRKRRASWAAGLSLRINLDETARAHACGAPLLQEQSSLERIGGAWNKFGEASDSSWQPPSGRKLGEVWRRLFGTELGLARELFGRSTSILAEAVQYRVIPYLGSQMIVAQLGVSTTSAGLACWSVPNSLPCPTSGLLAASQRELLRGPQLVTRWVGQG